ncbi:hypothetical protein MMC26_006904 [Xylographa opegraphella]|nr:hypothetical protein [Xylographa opegraphella]
MYPPQYSRNGPQHSEWFPSQPVQGGAFGEGHLAPDPPAFSYQPVVVPGQYLATGWYDQPQVHGVMYGGGPQQPNPPYYPFQQPNGFHPVPVNGSYGPPQVQHHAYGRGPQTLYPHNHPFQQLHAPGPSPVHASYLRPEPQYRYFEGGVHAHVSPAFCHPWKIPRSPALTTTQVQPSPPLLTNPLRVSSGGQGQEHPSMHQVTGSRADPISQLKAAPATVEPPTRHEFSAADLRHCSIPYIHDLEQPEQLFPVRHRMLVPSSVRQLRWYEWVNELPLPHLFRREIGRLEWLDIDVARKGTSWDAWECLVTITIMVEELSPQSREVVDRLTGVLRAQGYGNVRVEVGLYWYSVMDEFPAEHLWGLEELMICGMMAFLEQ